MQAHCCCKALACGIVLDLAKPLGLPAVAVAGRGKMEVFIAGHLDCSICYSVLVDPVVGRCGHDFCRTCLARWCDEQAAKFGKPPSCPLCRSALDNNPAVCLRLRDLTEQLFPEKVAARRQELLRAAAQRSQTRQTGSPAQHQRNSMGRTRILRARRTLPRHQHQQHQQHQHQHQQLLSAQASLPLAPDQGLGSSLQGQQGQGHGQQLQAFLLSTTAAAAAAAYAALSAIPGDGRLSNQRSSWVAPQVNFTMGWWEPSENRRKHGRSRMDRNARPQEA